ncbi:hypothetical protein [Rhizobium sp. LCM 4573]|uniref:hypothetical protein n=1 Tax=Rhizobium sp. LCM 4573 TaxID=1848291 RepID=UPI0008D921F7|nr:hypothetical protein [Rhizobium sp. LCM 4573]OHV76049.1 hypothetical protein LCM4573_15530 [Rhizobium sp. LCM 4573]
MKTALPLSLLILVSAQTANASSGEAWAEFEKTVEEKCLAAASGMIENPEAVVDPFGSERFGLAIVTGKAVGADARISHICVMDKQTQAVELGSELGEDRVVVELPD